VGGRFPVCWDRCTLFFNSLSAFHPSFAQSWEQKVQDRPLGTHPQVCGPYVDADDTQRKI
jgi:hypothetical protein